MSSKGGRPLKFESPEALSAVIEAYMDETPEDELTVTGLALAIGTSRQVLTDYEKRDGYREIIQRAKCRVENAYEKALRKHGRSGDIFALKNFGWTDRRTTELTGGIQVTGIERTIVEAADSDS